MPVPMVAIVVLAWNNLEDTLECLASLRCLRYPHRQVILVDNGSTDGTPEQVRASFPEVTVIENGRNLGVPAGYNVGFRHALGRGADHIVMLNNDTVVDPEMLEPLVAAAEAVDVGILVPVVYYHAQPDAIWSAGARYRRFPAAIVMEKRLFHPASGYHELQYAIGCALLITRRAFERAGLLDENIFFMWEDHDFAARVRKEGLRILQVPSSRVWHKVSRSTRPEAPLFWQMHGESGAIFFRRHSRHAGPAIVLHLGYFVVREFIVKRRWRFLMPFWYGLRRGLARPLMPVPRLGEM